MHSSNGHENGVEYCPHEDMATFDKLPARLRRILTGYSINLSAVQVRKELREYGYPKMKEELAEFSRTLSREHEELLQELVENATD